MITPSILRFSLQILFFLIILHIGISSKAQLTTVSGRIKNLSSKEIVFIYSEDELITRYDTVRIIDTDSFNVSFKTVKRPFYLDIRCNRKTLNLFVAPGYQLSISADANNLRESAIFSGNGWLASHYLQNVYQQPAVRRYSWRSDEQVLSNESFFYKCERFRFAKDSILESLHLEHGLTDPYWREFITSQKISDRYTEATGLINFSLQKNRTVEAQKEFYQKYVAPLEMNKEGVDTFLFLNSVKGYYALAFFQFYQFHQDSAHKLVSLERDGIYASYFKMSLNHYEGKLQRVCAGLVLDLLLSLLESQSLSIYPGRYPRVDSMINQYERIADNKVFVKTLRDRYEMVEQLTAFIPKEYLAELVLEDMQGIQTGLSTLKGKQVYIDFWASWCAPCIDKFEKLKALKPVFDSCNWVLVLINMDSDKGSWKNAVHKLNPPGLHYYAAGGMEGKWATFFNVRSIPRYLILNEAGDCINQFAPEPNDKALFEKRR